MRRSKAVISNLLLVVYLPLLMLALLHEHPSSCCNAATQQASAPLTLHSVDCLICQFLQTLCDEASQVTASIALPVSFVEAVNPTGVAVSVFLPVVDNLTDVCYQDHLSRLKYADLNVASGRRGVFNMGRNFVLKLAVPIG